MSWLRCAGLAFTSAFLIGCGQAATPVGQVSPAFSPTPTQQVTPSPAASPSAEPSSTPAVATVTCSGSPSTSMTVIAGVLLYDVADPINPHLVCRASSTFMQLVAGSAIVYTKAAAGGKAAIVRRDLTSGAESQVALLPADPGGSKNWTADGALEVYAGKAKAINEITWSVPIHLWARGGDRVIYSVNAGVGGIESRWSVVPIVEIGRAHV